MLNHRTDGFGDRQWKDLALTPHPSFTDVEPEERPRAADQRDRVNNTCISCAACAYTLLRIYPLLPTKSRLFIYKSFTFIKSVSFGSTTDKRRQKVIESAKGKQYGNPSHRPRSTGSPHCAHRRRVPHQHLKETRRSSGRCRLSYGSCAWDRIREMDGLYVSRSSIAPCRESGRGGRGTCCHLDYCRT